MVRRERCGRIHELLEKHGGTLDLWVGCDQVGTLKINPVLAGVGLVWRF